MELLTQKGVKRERRGRGMSKDDPKTISQKSVLTDVMVLFSAIDAAMDFPPSEPRPFADTSSYVPQENRKATLKLEQEKQLKAWQKEDSQK
jgi:hypothetical protein